MSIRREPSGRWRAVLKSGRRYVAGRTFDSKREAQAWLTRERAALVGGVDPRAGRATVKSLIPQWLDERRRTVAQTTAHADAMMAQRLPPSLTARAVGSVTDRDVQRVLNGWAEKYAEGSVKRWRAALAGFFKWCIAERLVSTNPVTGAVVPRKSGAPVRMHPLTAVELESVVGTVRHHDPHTADLILTAAWSGLRWGELRAVRVAHFARVPLPLLVVQEARPEGMETKTTKGRRARRVPIAGRILPLVEAFAVGKEGSDLLFTSASGAQLHAAAFKRASRWKETARGRRLHDLRHTAICLWLAHGVDPATVQAWAGHASIATTNLYVTHPGRVPTALDWTAEQPGARGGTRDTVANGGHDKAPGR